MIDETYRARWAWLLGALVSAGALALACGDATPPDEGDDDDANGGSAQGGTAGVATGGAAATGGTAPTGGVGGVAQGGTGSGGVSGAAATGGAAPMGGAAPTGGTAGVAGTPATGGTAGTPATGGTGGGATLVEPIQRGNLYVLEFGDLHFAVDPAGARIVDVHLTGGQNLLTGSTINATNFGSTFWTSPQATWNWPPVPEIDSAAYAPTVMSPAVEFLGPAGATRVQARVAKRFVADLQKQAVNAEYSVQATAAGQSFAPWEITRVFKRGLTFWPTGTPPRAGTMPILPTTNAAGCTWHEATPAATEGKLFANAGAGWLAHVDGDIVIVKKFPDIMPSQAAPNEDEIEVYVGATDYIEVEQQGAYQPVAQGASFTWTVNWFVRRLPQGVTATVGNEQLVSFVQSLVQ